MNPPEITREDAAILHAIGETNPGKAAAKRAMAIILLAAGHTTRHVATLSDVTPATVRGWLRAWKKEGITAIVTASRPRRSRTRKKLTSAARIKLRAERDAQPESTCPGGPIPPGRTAPA